MIFTQLKKTIHFILIFTVVGIVLYTPLSAQSYSWRSITSLREIREIAFYENKLWAMTGGGVFQYSPSSSTFRIFTNITGLSSNNPFSMVLDSNRFWLGMDDGSLNVIDLTALRIRRIQIDPSPITIRDITLYNGFLYLALDFGISQFDISKEEIKATFRSLGSFSKNTAVRSVLVANGALWAGTEKGIAAVPLSSPNLQDPQFWTNYTTAQGLPANSIKNITANGDTLFVGTENGIARIHNNTVTPEGLFGNSITAFANDNGTLYAATPLFVFKREQHGLWTIVSPDCAGIQTIAVDSTGKVWAGSVKKGLYTYDASHIQWVNIIPPGPGGNSFEEMVFDMQGRLWCATGQSAYNGLYLLENGNWLHFTSADGLTANNTIGIACDMQGRIWTGTPGQGLMIIEKQTDSLTITKIDTTTGRLHGSDTPYFVIVSRIIRGPGNIMWLVNKFANNGNAIVAVTPENTWHYFSTADGLSSTIISDITFDVYGRLWIATENNGVDRLDYRGTLSDKSDDIWNHFTAQDNLASNRVTRLAADRETGMWIGTENGISYIIDGLPIQNILGTLDPFITALAVDPANNKWFGTKNGISILQSDNSTWTYFTLKNSQLVYDNIISFRIHESSGDMYIGTSAGLSIVSTPFKTPPARFNAMRVYPSPFIIDGSQARLTIDNIPLHSMVKITTALSGKVIRTLTESNGGVNGTQAFWDGRDENNQFVPSGVYIIAAGRSKAGSGIVKIAIIRR